MRFLFTTLQHVESQFYGRVGTELGRRSHDVQHLTYSRRAAHRLGARGIVAHCLPDLMNELDLTDADVLREAARIEGRYGLPTLREVYRTDPACAGRPELWCVRRTVEHALAIERLLDATRPEVVVPEMGNETMRTLAGLVARDRGARVLYFFHTIFPRPLRVCVDDPLATFMNPAEAVALTADQREHTSAFIREFIARDRPIRGHRESEITLHRVHMLLRHTVVKAVYDRDNDYLHPLKLVTGHLLERVAARLASSCYRSLRPGRPYVYFPLHLTDDYKIKRLIPHCADQASIIAHVADALPSGFDVVTKEHPMSVGRTPLELLRRLRRIPNVRIVAPTVSTHDLIADAAGIIVIGSTVGLEALLHGRPVLTLGQPFYAGLGVTIDAQSLTEVRELVPAVLQYEPDHELILRVLHAAWQHCLPGAPVMADRSSENARILAGALEAAARSVPSVAAGSADGQPASTAELPPGESCALGPRGRES